MENREFSAPQTQQVLGVGKKAVKGNLEFQLSRRKDNGEGAERCQLFLKSEVQFLMVPYIN